MDEKKFFHLDLSIAIEASSNEEAYNTLIKEETIDQIREMILQSHDKIKEIIVHKEETQIIN